MNGEVTFEGGMRRALNIGDKKLLKGVGPGDIHTFLLDLVQRYLKLGRTVVFKWKKLGRNRNENNAGFTGKNIVALMEEKEENSYVIIGKSKRANESHRKLMTTLTKLSTDQNKVFAKLACGKSRPDHAIGVRTGKSPLIFDNGFRKYSKEFNIVNFATCLSDVTDAFVIDISEKL
jgi:hypothetical protein